MDDRRIKATQTQEKWLPPQPPMDFHCSHCLYDYDEGVGYYFAELFFCRTLSWTTEILIKVFVPMWGWIGEEFLMLRLFWFLFFLHLSGSLSRPNS